MLRAVARPLPIGASRLALSRRWSSWACLETPNPNVRKFEAAGSSSVFVVPAGYRDRLLSLDGVRDVFVAHTGATVDVAAAPWVSVTRAQGTSWEALAPRVQAALNDLQAASDSTGSVDDVDNSVGDGAASGVEAEIDEVLTHRVRPSVQADGGDVELISWDAASGEVLLRLKGACRGCPQSAVTLQETILKTLQHYVPPVRSVVAEEEEHDPEAAAADPYADIPWEHDGEPDPDAIIQAAAAGTPFFSIFAGEKMEGAKLRRVKFISRLDLQGRKPGHVFIKCDSCKARKTIEDPQDMLRRDKGNTTGNAAVVICPTCCVLISP